MKRLTFIALFYITNVQAQQLAPVPILEFKSVQNDIIILYTNDLENHSDRMFKILDTSKLNKLKTMVLHELNLICCGNKYHKISMQNALSSYLTTNDYYVLTFNNYHILFYKDSFFTCSNTLEQKLRDIIRHQ